jgi:hypothetical protein
VDSVSAVGQRQGHLSKRGASSVHLFFTPLNCIALIALLALGTLYPRSKDIRTQKYLLIEAFVIPDDHNSITEVF